MSEKQRRYLIISADDFGYSSERDDGILDCYQHGAITTVSVMMNGHSLEAAVQKARELNVPMDLHVNLTEGRPVSTHSSTFTDSSGLMLGKIGFRDAVSKHTVDLEEIRVEIQAQINKFHTLTGRFPAKVDGHQHAHIVPGICKVFAEVLEKYRVMVTRLPIEGNIDTHTWSSQQQHKFMLDVVQQSVQAQEVFLKHKIWAPGFVGLKTMGKNMSVSHVQNCIQDAFRYQAENSSDLQKVRCVGRTVENARDDNKSSVTGIICELMVHPGRRTGDVGGCGAGPDDFSQCPDREHEMEILTDRRMKDFYQENCITLISFEDCMKTSTTISKGVTS